MCGMYVGVCGDVCGYGEVWGVWEGVGVCGYGAEWGV